jgi:hypothetical protein
MSLFRASGPLQLPPTPIFAPDPAGSHAAVASLFSEPGTQPTPQLSAPPAPTRTSLFDGPVRDPLPSARGTAVRSNDMLELDVPAAPRRPEVSLQAPPVSLPAARQPPMQVEVKAVASAGPPPAPPEALRSSKKPVLSGKAAVPQPTPEDEAERRATPADDAAVPRAPTAARARKRARKREIPRGPSKLTLSILASATVLALGGAAALLGLIPSPLARPPASAVAGGMVRPAPVGTEVAHPPAQPKPPTMPAAASPAARPNAASSPTAKTPETGATPVVAAKPPEAEAKPATALKPAAAPQAATTPGVATPEAPAAHAAVAATSVRAASVAPPAAPSEDSAGGDASQALIASARKKLADDDAAAAEALLRQALAKDSQDHHAMELLVHALMDQDRGTDALPYARKIVQRRPRRVSYRLLLGDLLLMVGKEPEARSEWSEALKLAPDDVQIKRRLGQ